MKKITHIQAQSIIDIACATWKDTLFDKWGKQIVLKQEIHVSDPQYKIMRGVCTPEQHKLFDEIFGKDEPQFKVGDWVTRTAEAYGVHYKGKTFLISAIDGCQVVENGTINKHLKESIRFATPEEIKKATNLPEGTPCFVRDAGTDRPWQLYYADGNGRFYANGKKSEKSTVRSWDKVHEVSKGLPEE